MKNDVDHNPENRGINSRDKEEDPEITPRACQKAPGEKNLSSESDINAEKHLAIFNPHS